MVEPDFAQPFARDLVPVRDAADFEAEGDILDRGAPRHHAVAREHVADVVADAGDGTAVDLDLASARRHETGDDVEDRGFAAAGGADDGHDRAFRYVEGEVAHRHDRLAVARAKHDADIGQADLRRRSRYGVELRHW